MFPMGGGGLNPKQVERLMKQLGLKQEILDSLSVVINLKDGSKIIFDDPDVVKVNFQGQVSFQISGKYKIFEPTESEVNEEDIKLIMEQKQVSYEKAKEVLEKAKGDLAEALLLLEENES